MDEALFKNSYPSQKFLNAYIGFIVEASEIGSVDKRRDTTYYYSNQDTLNNSLEKRRDSSTHYTTN